MFITPKKIPKIPYKNIITNAQSQPLGSTNAYTVFDTPKQFVMSTPTHS